MKYNGQSVLVLFSSDSNPQYKKDIFNVIALPSNASYRFRYKEKYISEELKKLLDQKCVSNALIVFRTNSVEASVDPFMVPLRWAVIKEIDHIGNIYIIDFVVGEYVTFADNYAQTCNSYEKNKSFSKEYFARDKRNDEFVSIYNSDLEECLTKDQASQDDAWVQVIEALGKSDIFSDSFFFRVLLPENGNNEQFTIMEGQSNEITIVHYNVDDHNVHSADAKIRYDKSLITSVCGDVDRIECRYDRNKYIFIAKGLSHDVRTEIFFSIEGDVAGNNLGVRIPVVIKKAMRVRLVRWTLSFLGAIFVGLSGVFPCLPLIWKALAFGLGSLLISSSWLFSKGD